MAKYLKKILIGKPLKSEDIAHEKFDVIKGLSILSSDAISSVAYAAFTVDYILTVAVSESAGAAAITSAIPQFLEHKVSITLILITLMAIGNLRGIREASKIFSILTYFFIITILIMIFYGIFMVFLWSFAAGCTALTGVEAVSNGIPNFEVPR